MPTPISGVFSAMVKVVEGSEFVVSKNTTASTKLTEGDELLAARIIEGTETLVMRSQKDMFLRIACDTIPQKKKTAVGVRGMKLDSDDLLSDIYILSEEESVSIEVKGKEVALNRLRIGNRDTKGVKR